MDVLSLFQLLARRKLVVVPVTLLVIAGLALVYTSSPPLYRTSGSVVLLNPPSPPELPIGAQQPIENENPYKDFNDLSVVVDIVVRKMRSPVVDEDLRRKGMEGTLTLGANLDFYNGPIIDVTAEASSAAAAINAAQLAMTEIGEQLDVLQRQEGTSDRYFVKTATVVEPEKATSVFSGTLRRLVAAGALGVGAILASAIGAEATAVRWGQRRSRRRTEPGAPRKERPGNAKSKGSAKARSESKTEAESESEPESLQTTAR